MMYCIPTKQYDVMTIIIVVNNLFYKKISKIYRLISLGKSTPIWATSYKNVYLCIRVILLYYIVGQYRRIVVFDNNRTGILFFL